MVVFEWHFSYHYHFTVYSLLTRSPGDTHWVYCGLHASMLPCFHAIPNLNVSLWKDEEAGVVMPDLSILTVEYFLFYFSGMMECMAHISLSVLLVLFSDDELGAD
jgi:hypothetical protein